MLTNNSLQHKSAAGANHSTITSNSNDFGIAPRESDQTPQSRDLASLSWNEPKEKSGNKSEAIPADHIMNFIPLNAQKIAETQQPQAIINKFGITKKGQPWISYSVGDRKCSHFLSRKHFNQSLECLIYKINNVNVEVWSLQKKSHYFCSESRCSCPDYKFRSKRYEDYQCKHMRGLKSLSDKLPVQSKPQTHIFAKPYQFILTGDREHGWKLWNQQKLICNLPTINHLDNIISQYLNFGAEVIYVDDKYQQFEVLVNAKEEIVRRRKKIAS